MKNTVLKVACSSRKNIISERLIYLRHANRYDQKYVAAVLGIHPVTYNGYEHARAEPCLDMLVRICDFYGCSLDFLAGRENVCGNNIADIIESIDDIKCRLNLLERLI